MRPSSSPSEPAARGLFDAVLARGEAAAAVSDGAWLRAMLDVEAALARAQARAGLVPAADAEAIAAACDAERLRPRRARRRGRGERQPGGAARARVERGGAGDGRRARAPRGDEPGRARLGGDARGRARARRRCSATSPVPRRAAATLAGDHRDTLMAGRTLLQHALPVTFGLKAAGWMVAPRRGARAAGRRAPRAAGRAARRRRGHAGRARRARARGARRAGARARPGRAACCPGTPTARGRPSWPAGSARRPASWARSPRDVALLAQTEVGELREDAPGRGGSSTLPHKRNPVAAIAARACALRAPGLVATLLGAMAHEHERAAGAWHAEWRPLSELLARPVPRPRGCATASSTSRSTARGCARTST